MIEVLPGLGAGPSLAVPVIMSGGSGARPHRAETAHGDIKAGDPLPDLPGVVGDVLLTLVEVQSGSCLGQDDIEHRCGRS